MFGLYQTFTIIIFVTSIINMVQYFLLTLYNHHSSINCFKIFKWFKTSFEFQFVHVNRYFEVILFVFRNNIFLIKDWIFMINSHILSFQNWIMDVSIKRQILISFWRIVVKSNFCEVVDYLSQSFIFSLVVSQIEICNCWHDFNSNCQILVIFEFNILH